MAWKIWKVALAAVVLVLIAPFVVAFLLVLKASGMMREKWIA
jgi:hypothetical protein